LRSAAATAESTPPDTATAILLFVAEATQMDAMGCDLRECLPVMISIFS
jgi:hypothetical protein